MSFFPGDFERAEKYHLATIKYRKQQLGENHPFVGASYNNLGLLYQQKDEHEQSLEFFVKGLEIKKKTKASTVSIISSLSNIANTYNALGNFEAAHAQLDEAFNIIATEKTIFTVLDAQSLVYNTRGKVYLKEGKLEDSHRAFAESVRLSEDSLPNNFLFMKRLASLGKVQERVGQFTESMKTLKRALSLKEDSIKQLAHNEIVTECLECLMRIYRHFGDSSKYKKTLFELEAECFRLESVCLQKENLKRLDFVYKTMDNVHERMNEVCEVERGVLYTRTGM